MTGLVVDMTILAIDIGTTHCKAGLFALDGTALKIAKRPMVTQRTPSGEAYFDPEALWATAAAVIRKVAAAADTIAAVGIAPTTHESSGNLLHPAPHRSNQCE